MKASNLLNMTVKHKIWGDGTVIEIEDKYITFQFASKKSEFIFPDAFEKFLFAKDELVQASVLKVITEEKTAAERKTLVKNAEVLFPFMTGNTASVKKRWMMKRLVYRI